MFSRSRWCILPSSQSTPTSSSARPASARIQGRADWLRLVVGLFVVFGLFHGSATILESDRGQRGFSSVCWSSLRLRRPTGFCCASSGGRRSDSLALDGRGQRASSSPASSRPPAGCGPAVGACERAGACPLPWMDLTPPGAVRTGRHRRRGLFRGYLFGHIRTGKTFWRAAAASMLPFVSVHLVLFFSMPWPIALSPSPRARHQLPARTSFRTGRRHDLGSRHSPLRDSDYGEGGGVSAWSRIVRTCLDGGECDGSAAGLHGQSPDASVNHSLQREAGMLPRLPASSRQTVFRAHGAN